MKELFLPFTLFQDFDLALADDLGRQKPPANSNERMRPEVVVPGTTSSKEQPARITVPHKGMVVHHAYPLGKGRIDAGLGPSLRNHVSRVRHRNIWIRPLKDYS